MYLIPYLYFRSYNSFYKVLCIGHMAYSEITAIILHQMVFDNRIGMFT